MLIPDTNKDMAVANLIYQILATGRTQASARVRPSLAGSQPTVGGCHTTGVTVLSSCAFGAMRNVQSFMCEVLKTLVKMTRGISLSMKT